MEKTYFLLVLKWIKISKTKNKVLFGFSTFLCWFCIESRSQKNKKNHLFWVFWYLDWHIHSKKQKLVFFAVFISKSFETQKKTFESKNILSKLCFFVFLVLLEFFVFFCLSIDSHDCHLCPYACLPYRSWEVKLWPKFLTQELAHYVRLSLA